MSQTTTPQSPDPVGGRQPNVVLIVSDDQGYADRSALGLRSDVRTPALDRLAAEGVDCRQAYVTAPICSPSRSSIISGQYQNRWGVHWFDDSRYGEHTPSLAESLKDLGYHTGYLGKVHYGPEDVGDRGAPPQHGFDETYYGLAGRQNGRLHYLRHSRAAVEEYGDYASARSAVQPMLDGDQEVELEGFLTEELGRRARDFVSDHSDGDQPFFLMLAFNAVHNFCWQLPPEELSRRGLPEHEDFTGRPEDYLDWYDGQVAPGLAHGREYYLAQLELMDLQIGLLLDHLDDQDVAEDTIVVYLTDNGGSRCNFGDNDPLRGGKYTLWEGGVRVPFIVRWPGGSVPAGEHRAGLVSAMDIYPTVLAAAGAAPATYGHSDGIDLLPVLRDDRDGHRTLHWDHGFQWAIRSGRWKLAYVDAASPSAEGVRVVEHADPGDGYRLFDLEADPGETTDLYAQRPEVVAELQTLRDQWRAEVEADAERHAVDTGEHLPMY